MCFIRLLIQYRQMLLDDIKLKNEEIKKLQQENVKLRLENQRLMDQYDM